MSASELLSDFVESGGGGGGHTYSVLCTMWATIGPRCSVVYGATRHCMTRGARHRIVWRERVAYTV